MFDCFLKKFLLLIDAVMNDREAYAQGEKHRYMVMLDEQKHRFEKEISIYEQKTEEVRDHFDQ
jgi:hypothetical protein